MASPAGYGDDCYHAAPIAWSHEGATVPERGGNRPAITLEGELVALGPPRRDLLPTYRRWHNDVATTRTYALTQPTTIEQEEDLLATLTGASDMVIFTIYDRGAWRPIGTTYLTDIDHRHGSAEFGILIGEARDRGQGYGAEATRLMLDFAFSALGLHSVMLTVYEYNLAGRRVYEKSGFREVGRRRQSHWLGGHWWDEIIMDCLAPERASSNLEPISAPNPPPGPPG